MARRPNYTYQGQAGIGQAISNLGTALFGDPQAMLEREAMQADMDYRRAATEAARQKMQVEADTHAADLKFRQSIMDMLTPPGAGKPSSPATAAPGTAATGGGSLSAAPSSLSPWDEIVGGMNPVINSYASTPVLSGGPEAGASSIVASQPTRVPQTLTDMQRVFTEPLNFGLDMPPEPAATPATQTPRNYSIFDVPLTDIERARILAEASSGGDVAAMISTVLGARPVRENWEVREGPGGTYLYDRDSGKYMQAPAAMQPDADIELRWGKDGKAYGFDRTTNTYVEVPGALDQSDDWQIVQGPRGPVLRNRWGDYKELPANMMPRANVDVQHGLGGLAYGIDQNTGEFTDVPEALNEPPPPVDIRHNDRGEAYGFSSVTGEYSDVPDALDTGLAGSGGIPPYILQRLPEGVDPAMAFEGAKGEEVFRTMAAYPEMTFKEANDIASDILARVLDPESGALSLVNMAERTQDIMVPNYPERQSEIPAPGEGGTLAEMAASGNVAGPVAAVQEITAPVVAWAGGEVPDDVVQARQTFRTELQSLIRATANNDRFPVLEMERIREEINLAPKTWDASRTLLSRMVSLRATLERRLAEENDAAKDMRLPRVERQGSAVRARHVENFLRVMGDPQAALDNLNRAAGSDAVLSPEEEAMMQELLRRQ